MSEKSINKYFIIPKRTLFVSDAEFADIKQIRVIRLWTRMKPGVKRRKFNAADK